MDNLIGYPLKDAIKLIAENNETENRIINIKKIIGTNNKFNDLNKPYVIRVCDDELYITLFVSYY